MNVSSLSSVASVPRPQNQRRDERPGYFAAGTGSPVLMLHSSLSSKSQWTALAERLSPQFRVIALDLCGYGDNQMKDVGAPFTLDEELRLVAATLDRLVEPHVRIHVVGHSYGGLVALRFAQSRRGRVASLSLYEPVVFRALDEGDVDLMNVKLLSNRLKDQIAGGKRHDAARAFVDFWSGDGSYASLPLHVRASIARRVDKLPLDFQAAWHWPRDLSELGAIITPTLLMSGDHSPAFVQRIATVLAGKLPNCRVRQFDSGHMGAITDAALINPWIEAFLHLCVERDAAIASLRAVL